ncbi:MAG: HlyU family transcriptional regulator [Gammaproteobacteria bacterium]
MGSIFARLMGWLGGASQAAGGGGERGKPQEYNGFLIQAAPLRDGSHWLTAGFISKKIGDEQKEHQFIRADTHTSREDAEAFSLTKARLIIDEQGDKLFEQ